MAQVASNEALSMVDNVVSKLASGTAWEYISGYVNSIERGEIIRATGKADDANPVEHDASDAVCDTILRFEEEDDGTSGQ